MGKGQSSNQGEEEGGTLRREERKELREGRWPRDRWAASMGFVSEGNQHHGQPPKGLGGGRGETP